MTRALPLFVLVLLAGCATTRAPSEADARVALDRAERAWLDAYVDNDREAMARFLAEGFTITFPGDHVDTRDDVIAGLVPGAPRQPGPVHYTEDRTIRLYGTTAILTGIYVSPREDGSAGRMRYTDTWMWLDGRWQVVASHLTQLPDRPAP